LDPSPSPTPTPTSAATAGSGQDPDGHGSTSPPPAPARDPSYPAPFAPLAAVASTASSDFNLDSAHIPPIEALSPMSGLRFGSALQLGPILLLIDLLGLAGLYYFVRYRWRARA
jgi:hypothetical protein